MAEEVAHRLVETNGVKIHIAEQGSGPLVLLLHGFPELWYSWRHQMSALADAGYHAVAPDLRGYGQSEAPVGVENYTSLHVVGDLVGLLDALDEQQAFVVGHDWGAIIGWDLCLFRPDRVKAYVALSVPFQPRRPGMKPVDVMRKGIGEGFYYCRFQEPGRAEADFARFDVKTVMKAFLVGSSSGKLPIAPKDKELLDILPATPELPSWISDSDLDYYAEQFSKTGFTGPLNYYRATDLNWELKAPWTGAKVHVPTLFITGDKDLVYHFPRSRDYIHRGGFIGDVPNLQEPVILPGVSHFLQQESPEQVNELLIKFLGQQKLRARA